MGLQLECCNGKAFRYQRVTLGSAWGWLREVEGRRTVRLPYSEGF